MKKYVARLPVSIWFALSGILMGVAFTRWYLWWVVFLGLAIFVWLLTRTASPRRAFVYGWIAGVIKMLFVYTWILSVYPLTWTGIDSAFVQGAMVGGYWALIALVLGFGYGVIAFVFVKYRAAYPSGALALFPVFLLGGEVLGALLYGVVSVGPGVGLSLIYTHGYTGLTLADHSIFKWFATLGGVYALTLVVGALSVLIALFFQTLQRRSGIQKMGGALVVAVLIVFGFVSPTSVDRATNEEQPERVAVITTAFPRETLVSKDPSVLFMNHRALLDAVRRAAQSDVSAIILPESSRLGEQYLSEEDILELLHSEAGDDIILIDNMRTFRDAREVSTLVTYDTKNNAVYYYDKQHLVAFGEYRPYFALPFFGGREAGAGRAVDGATLSTGIPRSSVELPSHVPSAIFCAEVGVPWSMKRVAKERSESPYIVYTASHAWFTSSREPTSGWNQLDWMLKIHALWSGKDVIQAANMAPSAHYKSDGTLGELREVYQNTQVRVEIAEI